METEMPMLAVGEYAGLQAFPELGLTIPAGITFIVHEDLHAKFEGTNFYPDGPLASFRFDVEPKASFTCINENSAVALFARDGGHHEANSPVLFREMFPDGDLSLASVDIIVWSGHAKVETYLEVGGGSRYRYSVATNVRISLIEACNRAEGWLPWAHVLSDECQEAELIDAVLNSGHSGVINRALDHVNTTDNVKTAHALRTRGGTR